METRALQYFLALAEHNGLGAAASACDSSEQDLSSGLNSLAAELGGPLFSWEGDQASLTDLGARMHPQLKRIRAASEMALVLPRNSTSLEMRALQVGVSVYVDSTLYRDSLDGIASGLGQPPCEVTAMPEGRIVADLRSDGIDAGIVESYVDIGSDIEAWPICAGDLGQAKILAVRCSDRPRSLTAVLLAVRARGWGQRSDDK